MRRLALAVLILLAPATAWPADGPRHPAFAATPAPRTEAPRLDAAGALACPGHLPALTAFRLRNGRSALLCTAPGDAQALVATQPQVPRGWRRAWDDGRLNPLRGAPTTR